MNGNLERAFPNLARSGYSLTSPASPDYNCIAWAIGETERWWWPNPFAYWPPAVPTEETLEAFTRAFAAAGFAPCDHPNLEQGFEKVAIYSDATGKPTHAARQLPSGQWSSKLGRGEDIEHDLAGLMGAAYGSVAKILKRPILS